MGGSESTDVFASIEKSLGFLKSENGKVDIHKESGLITAIDYRENLEEMAEFLDRVTESLNRQVMIEAKLVEITLSEGQERGVDWKAILGDVEINIDDRTSDRTLNAVIDTGHILSVIDALAERHEVSVRSSPRVSALNNQTAMIVLGEEEVFFETVAEVDPETGRTISHRTQPRSVTIGVSLSVVSQISKDGVIMMNIHPRVTEKIGEKVSPDGIRVPQLTVRDIDTVARVKEGDTMLIAGLTTERKVDSEWAVPLLGRIPFLGELFKTKRAETLKRELVIFITPTLVEELR